jgi:D-serine deaminase-like pyridoxal phosphate-dependent protein
MSRPTEDRAIIDAGLKALAFDSGPQLVWDEPAATYERASDEHGRLADEPARARRQDPADPRALRPDRQPLRLVCLCPR